MKRKGPEHITVPIQIRRIDSAVESGDWGKVREIGSSTKSLEVGKYAVDAAVREKEWGAVMHISIYGSEPAAKYAWEQLEKHKEYLTRPVRDAAL